MKTVQRNILLLASLLFTAVSLLAQTESQRLDPAVEKFWNRFRKAVEKNDKELVASMVKFPLRMPYGVRQIKSSSEFLRKYRRIFDRQTRVCFTAAMPQPEAKGAFTIGCGVAMLYWFEKVKGEYRMTGVDNVNE